MFRGEIEAFKTKNTIAKGIAGVKVAADWVSGPEFSEVDTTKSVEDRFNCHAHLWKSHN